MRGRNNQMTGVILVVEDDPTLLRAISRNLTARGYVTRGAASVAAALAAIEDVRPAAVVLDVALPDGSGWEVVRALRGDGGPNAAVIVLSALRPNQRLIGELGVTHVLEKPFPMESLLRLVEESTRRPAISRGANP